MRRAFKVLRRQSRKSPEWNLLSSFREDCKSSNWFAVNYVEAITILEFWYEIRATQMIWNSLRHNTTHDSGAVLPVDKHRGRSLHWKTSYSSTEKPKIKQIKLQITQSGFNSQNWTSELNAETHLNPCQAKIQNSQIKKGRTNFG